MREAERRGEELGLTDDELAFYDALETNDSAVKVLGDETSTIARELVATVRKNVTIDWTLRENVRAQLRVLVKRILRKYGYPPDKQEKATQTVLEQAEVLSAAWAEAGALAAAARLSRSFPSIPPLYCYGVQRPCRPRYRTPITGPSASSLGCNQLAAALDTVGLSPPHVLLNVL